MNSIQNRGVGGVVVPVFLLALIFGCASAGFSQTAKSELSGKVTDPSGKIVAGATVNLKGASGVARTVLSDAEGNYSVMLEVGKYELTVEFAEFETWKEEVTIATGKAQRVDVTLKIAMHKESVTVERDLLMVPLAGNETKIDATEKTRGHNTAQLLAEEPGVSLRTNGEFGSIPLLHGMGDERAKLVVNGVTISNACANHMNPPLSYINPWNVSDVRVIAGITPVSMGGDSIGGTVSVDSPAPVFPSGLQGWRGGGMIAGFYRSNGENYGPAVSLWGANSKFYVGYTGSWVNADDYSDGRGHKVTSTYAQGTNNDVTVAARAGANLFTFQAGLHHMPYEGFTNAQMDLVRNYAESMNMLYQRRFKWGSLDARAFWQGTWHSMNIGKDKSTFPMPMWMPMNSHGRDFGYTVSTVIPLVERQNLRVGTEFHRFVLDDDWPPVAGTEPFMGPDTFVSINDGRRYRLAWYGELVSKWSTKWSTILGIRNDTIWTNAGPVSGYSEMYAADANAFNVQSHERTDINLDLVALARYKASETMAFEMGYSRKTRTPNLYERYAWSTDWMASGMIGWYGDGNYYVGNLYLKPEVAHTVGGTFRWQNNSEVPVSVKITPYYTYISNYVDVNTLATTTYGESTFAQLQFANFDARIYGVDAEGKVRVWNDSKYGQGEFGGVLGYLHGERIDHDMGLYQMMPLNLRLSFEERLKQWNAGIQLQLVDRKSNTDPQRFEQATPGYVLLGVHLGYERGKIRVDAGCDNLLNRWYELPLGGVNFDDFMASGWMSAIKPLTGRGRSIFLGVAYRF
ncbi:MAG: TonB-dependent receptor [Terriglobia bacterium]